MSKNVSVVDVKPQNQSVVDTKPQMERMDIPIETEQQYTLVTPAGAPMGLLLALTYLTAGTWQSPISN